MSEEVSLDVGEAIRDGIRRTTARNGQQLMAVFLGLGLVNAVASHTLQRANARFLETLPEAPDIAQGATPFALPAPLPVAIGFAFLVAVAAEAVRVVAVRTLVSDVTETIPAEFRRRRLLWATGNSFIGGIVVFVLIAIGLVFLVVPGIFLGLVFFFVRQEIAVEDRNFIDAMAGSWYLTDSHRWSLLALGLVVVAVSAGAAVPVLALQVVAPSIAPVVGAATSAVTGVFGIAVSARAYDQLRAARADRLAVGQES